MSPPLIGCFQMSTPTSSLVIHVINSPHYHNLSRHAIILNIINIHFLKKHVSQIIVGFYKVKLFQKLLTKTLVELAEGGVVLLTYQDLLSLQRHRHNRVVSTPPNH